MVITYRVYIQKNEDISPELPEHLKDQLYDALIEEFFWMGHNVPKYDVTYTVTPDITDPSEDIDALHWSGIKRLLGWK